MRLLVAWPQVIRHHERVTTGSEGGDGEDPVDGVVDEIVSRLGLRVLVETEATTDDHAPEVAGLIADAAAEKARFEDMRDASWPTNRPGPRP